MTDDRGKTLRLSEPATRPAAISTFGADVALALSTPPVAVTDYGIQGIPDYLASELTGVHGLGPRHQPNLEVLSSVRPDLVIAIGRYTEKDGDQIEAIAPLLALDLITVQDSLRAVELAGQALGAPAKATELNARFLERLGFDNVGGKPPNPDSGIPLGYRISLEALLELNPDTILLLPTRRQRAFTMNPIWPYLKAVRNNGVYEVPQYWKEGAGPIARERILDDIQRLLLTSAPTEPTNDE
ncbi:ABC transporter substrate-binding protein [Marinobacter sp. Arc7-DN-1]|nr:ABC transporter substrate-binding protein [Marinobacter sp. Arc7-DN-1]